MTFRETNPKRLAALLSQGTHEGELRKFFAESRAQLLLKGAKIQNVPHGREERIRAICERLPPKTDDVLRGWFKKNISVTSPASQEEVLLYLSAYFDEDETLPEAEAQVICRSALVYIFADEADENLLNLLQYSRENTTSEAVAIPRPDNKEGPLAAIVEAKLPAEVIDDKSSAVPADFQLAELLSSIILDDETAIDNALAPFAERTQLMVEALLRLRDGDAGAARDKLSLLEGYGPEAELVRSALARASHLPDLGVVSTGVRMAIPRPLSEDPEATTYEVIGAYTNESETGAIFVQPLFLVVEGQLFKLNNDDRGRLFPDSGSVMTSRTVLRRQLIREELIHWTVSERDRAAGGRTRFHMIEELNPLIKVVPIQAPSSDADEVRDRVKAYAALKREHPSQQIVFLLSDGVAIVSPKGADLARDEGFQSPWQAWGSLDTWLIEGHQYYLGVLPSKASHLDLSPLDAAFRRLLKDLDAEHDLTLTKAQRSELTARLRSQSGGEIAQRAKRIAASIDQISINEEELNEVLKLLELNEIVRRRVDELIASEYVERQAELTGLQGEISALKKRKLDLENSGREIERSNRAKLDSIATSVREVFVKAVKEGASTLAAAEIFQMLTPTVTSVPRQAPSVASSAQTGSWTNRCALSETDMKDRLSLIGINRRQAYLLSKLTDITATCGVLFVVKGQMARQCVQTLIRRDREAIEIVDIPMGLTSGSLVRQVVANLGESQGVALLNADLSPFEVYGVDLIDFLIDQTSTSDPHVKPILLSCLGGDLCLPLPNSLRRVSVVIDLDSNWDEGEQLLDDIDPSSLLLLPSLQEKIFSTVSTMDDVDRRHIESAVVRAITRD